MNALPMISHRVFAAAAGNGGTVEKIPARGKFMALDTKNSWRLLSGAEQDSAPPSAEELRAIRSAAKDGI